MSLGCSNTEGVGVNYNDTWPAQFSYLIPNSVRVNKVFKYELLTDLNDEKKF